MTAINSERQSNTSAQSASNALFRPSNWIQGYWRANDWNYTSQQLLTFLKQHLELGISTVDHANIYGNPSCESLFGQALELDPSVRDKLQIISKCGIHLNHNNDDKVSHYTSTKDDIISSVETSLERLNTDYLDVLLIHRPDFLMDVDEMADTFEQLKRNGKVAHFGVSNFSPSQFCLLQSRLEDPLVTNQVEINPVNFDAAHDGTLDQLQQLKVRPMAWSCLAGGTIFDGTTEQLIRLRATLETIAEELNCDSIEQVIFAWIRALPSKPMLILGSGKIERAITAIESEKLVLSREQWYRIWVASKGHSVP
jgi:predicted oxidoreductase